MATLRKQLASQEHDLSVAKDDLKDSIQQLRRKVNFLSGVYVPILMVYVLQLKCGLPCTSILPKLEWQLW